MAVDCDPFNAPQLPPWLPGPVLRPAVVFECVDGPSVIESIVTLRLSTGEPYVWSAISSFPLRSQKVRRAEPESICIGGDGTKYARRSRPIGRRQDVQLERVHFELGPRCRTNRPIESNDARVRAKSWRDVRVIRLLKSLCCRRCETDSGSPG